MLVIENVFSFRGGSWRVGAALSEHPQWYRNLLSTPDTTVQIKGGLRPVRARRADAAEREALWLRLLDVARDLGHAPRAPMIGQ
ncbi:nitroreductase/quinone reductase family protein [Prauserella flavalba]|uniref:Nitroreductase family deazaflavin-dependent oxidoreductase n=1 Tax=Prauserella flavalba TaxID=1477506 RepID=A0A318LNC8_9PSEU|nr:nitroreductase/quinone reductase family protein [Prauserella flavalba]PXY36136.1 hypothetical protein BA062_11905 [Prauserella flavalba]